MHCKRYIKYLIKEVWVCGVSCLFPQGTDPQTHEPSTSHCMPKYSMVAVARAWLISAMTNCWPWWHSSDSLASRGHSISRWQKCTCKREHSLWFIFVCLLKPTQDVFYTVLCRLKKEASVAMATGKHSKLSFSLSDALRGCWCCLHKNIWGGWLCVWWGLLWSTSAVGR